MNIHSLLSRESVLPKLKVKDKETLLNRLVDLLENQVTSTQLESIRKAVFEREDIMSTGVGKGLAIPHGKASGIETNYASFAILDSPIYYEAIDDKPVQLVFLLVGPESKNSTHIKLLSRISRLMNSSKFREALIDSETPEEILNLFKEEEHQYFEN
jgi:mannitol/fructose-specific phosphotransferase system IIA component (Ntr-type)